MWSGGFTAVRLALDHVEPLTLQTLRYAIVVAGLAPLLLLLRRGTEIEEPIAASGFLGRR